MNGWMDGMDGMDGLMGYGHSTFVRILELQYRVRRLFLPPSFFFPSSFTFSTPALGHALPLFLIPLLGFAKKSRAERNKKGKKERNLLPLMIMRRKRKNLKRREEKKKKERNGNVRSSGKKCERKKIKKKKERKNERKKGILQ